MTNAGRALRGTLVRFALLVFVVLTLSRAGLCLWLSERAGSSLGTVMLRGAGHDAAAVVGFAGPVLVLVALVAARSLRVALTLLRIALAGLLAAFCALEAITPTYVIEFDARPNLLFAEYLEFPIEMVATLWKAHPVALLLLVVGGPIGVVLGARMLRADAGEVVERWDARRAFVVAAVGFVLGALGLPVVAAPSAMTMNISGDALVNSLPLNSLSSVVAAATTTARLEVAGTPLHDDHARCEAAVASLASEVFAAPAGDGAPHDDVVIVVAEGLGADVVASLGGRDFSPQLDALGERGVVFERMHATGTRSAHGLEAVLCAQLPSAMRSLVKRAAPSDEITTLGTQFRAAGYTTAFLYGGDANFDHMARFVANHGFDHVIDEGDIDDVTFRGPWGVCDGDLYSAAERHLAEQSGPTFTVVFTNSNHAPWSVPDDAPHGNTPRETAVRYADRALGDFVDGVQHRAPSTTVLVVADHNARTAGPALVPVDAFHIPAVLLGPGLAPQRIDTLASQIDLAPTLLAHVGIQGVPGLGRDLLATLRSPGRAVLHFHGANAFVTDDATVIHRFGHPTVVHGEASAGTITRALGYASWPLLTR